MSIPRQRSIREQHLFEMAEQALTRVIERIEDHQWDLPLAEGGMTTGTVRDLVDAHARDDQWVGHVLSGATIEDGKARFPEQPLGADPKAGWRAISERAVADALALDEPERVVHLSFGDYTARDYLQQVIAYRGLQAWELARAIKVDDPLPDELVRGMAEMLVPVAEQWRELGVFGPAVPVGPDASELDKLLALTGRRP